MEELINKGIEKTQKLTKEEMVEIIKYVIPKVKALYKLSNLSVQIAVEVLEGLIYFVRTGVIKHGITKRNVRILIEVLENIYELSDAADKELFKFVTTMAKEMYKD